jgi:radical SAM protein with 4Fe4S-binding SPASM domain
MKNKYQDYVCIRPFAEAQIMANGDVLGCCPAWVNHFKLGNLKKKSLKEIWNDKPAQEFRKSILDGSFRFCNEKSCPIIQSKHGEVVHRSELNKVYYQEVIDDIKNEKIILNHDPIHYQMAYDRSCNLSCPSCRSDLIYAKGKEREEIDHFQAEIMANIKTSRRLTITPSGDPFASITFRNFLINLKQEDAPNLHGITLLTNGILLKKYWYSLSEFVRSKIDCISVSVDATTSDVYSKIRRGGDFNILIENLEYIRDIIKVPNFAISTVIQKDNYEQLSDFITFAQKFKCNRLQYQIIEPDFRIWESESYIDEWKDKAVHEKTHLLHDDFKKYVNDINLNQPNLCVDFGPLLNLKNGSDISQLETVENEHKKLWKRIYKDVWYNDEVHLVNFNSIKKININNEETDAVYLDKLKIYVYWDKQTDEWKQL